MRESRKGEKAHLPQDSTEGWLGAQKPVQTQVRRRRPPRDSYELWVNRRVVAARGQLGKRRSA